MQSSSNPSMPFAPGTHASRGASKFAWLQPILLTCLACIAVFTLARIGTVIWASDRLAAYGLSGLGFIFTQGLRFDLVALGLLLGIPAILSPLFFIYQPLGAAWLRVLQFYCLLVLAFVLFMELATPSFIAEFDAKPDRRFIEYLVYPKEVFGMLWSAYRWQFAGAGIAIAAAIYGLRRLLATRTPAAARLPILLMPVLVLLSAFVVLAAVRSTADHRPVNPSTVVFTGDPLVNQMALNSSYTVLYAAYELQHEGKNYPYQKVSNEQAVQAARREARIDPKNFVADPNSTLHHQVAGNRTARPLNIVIVLEESLGADFVASLGGLPLTPELDKLQNEGISFTHLYATGTRSIRGIEGVVTGFLPTVNRAVVKLPRAQTGFFTIAGLLRSHGYSTTFLYSGEPQFDNMGRFFGNNGFDTIMGRHDFTGPVFDGDWGASDGDLFRLADQYFRDQPKDKPFFTLLFTTSNHSPWDYPPGLFEPYNEPAATRENAVKYADYAIGEFFRTAKQSPYWNNTIFLIIADHVSHVTGGELVPIEKFHIPALILGGSIKPQRIDRIASQIDMLPTLLSLAGVDADHPAIGIDQTRNDLGDFPGRAIMQFDDNQGYLEGERVAILQKDLPARQYLYRNQQLTETEADPAFMEHAIALANWPWYAYLNGTYRLPEPD